MEDTVTDYCGKNKATVKKKKKKEAFFKISYEEGGINLTTLPAPIM